MNDERPGWVNVRQLAAMFPFASEGAIRKWFFTDARGFRSRCARTLGRRVVISVPEFERWLDEQRTDSHAARGAA